MKSQWILILILSLVTGLLGCAPIQTKVAIDPTKTNAGLAYFLPQRDLLVHYRTQYEDDQCHETLALSVGEPYADPRSFYVAKISPIFFGDNQSKLLVTPEGLLHSAVSDSNPAFREIILSAAQSITELASRRMSMDREARSPDECVNRDFRWTITLPLQSQDLGNHLSVEKSERGYLFRFQQQWTRWSFMLERPNIVATGASPTKEKLANGLFYRVNLPYRVRFDSELARRLKRSNGAVVYLPNESPSLLAPTPGSVFGKKLAEITFDQGTLVSYKADFEGDGKQVAALPVEVLSAVTAAASNVFRGRKDRREQAHAALQAELRLERLQRQQRACAEALKLNDSSKIESACDF